MQKYQDSIALTNGNAVSGASVLVKTLAGVTATIYSDNGVTQTTNPLTTDANGRFSFYAADGRYTLEISGTDITTTTITDILLEDPADATAGILATDVSFTPSGTGATTRTMQDIGRSIVRSGDFDTTGHFNTAVTLLTETIGIHSIQTAQTTETTGVKILENFPVTSGFAPWQIHYNSFANTGIGAGTYNHATHVGYNVNRHSSTGTATANKPALIMGMEDNYFDDGGDNHYGMEWYVEYYSPDGTSIQMRRPFYARVQSSDNTADNCTVKVEVGTDGAGQFIVKTDSSHTLFQVAPSSGSTQVNYLKVTGGTTGVGVVVGSNGEANAPLLITSNGTGRIDLMTGFASRIGVRVVDTASSVNFAQFAPGGTGVGPTLSAQGETNVPLNINSKGTGSIVLATGGGTQLTIANTASTLNSLLIAGGGTGVAASVGATGEANAPLAISSSGSGRIDFLSGFFSQVQFRVSHTASATRFLQVTGSNGGNPTLSASAGSVNIGSALQLSSLGAFASGDKYLIVDASGNVHVSGLGPAS